MYTHTGNLDDAIEVLDVALDVCGQLIRVAWNTAHFQRAP